ncbi:DUF2867 domain-containing protein [Chitinophaga vietnamensis]|uniref:DUF2867 domain-containing protein n=1 Tax=Chitinophaga vietnamensis TaxID=2593957 RepID=UPI001178806B|nr:DUF2867 domain-containing protein [Chitinophaga vietnamensis]
MKIMKTSLPADSLLWQQLPAIHYKDAYTGPLPHPTNLLAITQAFVFSAPRWVEHLLHFRDAIVKWFGLKTDKQGTARLTLTPGEQAGIFTVITKNDHELIMGTDDKHLDFRVSLYLRQHALVCSTIVYFNNRWGRFYFFFVKPFHRLIVPVMVKSALMHLKASEN